jgi:hypothetical protein
MNRTLKEATVRRYHDDSHDQLRQHLGAFLDAYNFGKRLKTLNGLTPFEFICVVWTKEPDRFRLDPTRFTPGLHNYSYRNNWPAVNGPSAWWRCTGWSTTSTTASFGERTGLNRQPKTPKSDFTNLVSAQTMRIFGESCHNFLHTRLLTK